MFSQKNCMDYDTTGSESEWVPSFDHLTNSFVVVVIIVTDLDIISLPSALQAYIAINRNLQHSLVSGLKARGRFNQSSHGLHIVLIHSSDIASMIYYTLWINLVQTLLLMVLYLGILQRRPSIDGVYQMTCAQSVVQKFTSDFGL